MKYKKDTGYHLTQCLNLIYPKGHAFFTDNRQDNLKDLADEVSKLDQMPKQLMRLFSNDSSKNEVTWAFLKLWAKSPVVMAGGIFLFLIDIGMFASESIITIPAINFLMFMGVKIESATLLLFIASMLITVLSIDKIAKWVITAKNIRYLYSDVETSDLQTIILTLGESDIPKSPAIREQLHKLGHQEGNIRIIDMVQFFIEIGRIGSSESPEATKNESLNERLKAGFAKKSQLM